MSFWKLYLEQRKEGARFFSLTHPSQAVTSLYQSMLIKRILVENQQAVFVFETEKDLFRARENLSYLGSALADRVVPYRQFDVWGREKYGNNRDLVGERLASLLKNIEVGGEGLIWFTTTTSLFHRTIGSRLLMSQTLKVSLEDELDLDVFISKLKSLGYREVDEVKEPLTLAVRGCIVDIYPFSSDIPYRVEFLGDYISSIRVFNVETQVSLSEHCSLTICADGEHQATWDYKERSQRVYEALIAEKTDRYRISAIIDAINQGYYFNGFELYYPILREYSETLYHITADSAVFFMFDEDVLEAQIKSQREIYESKYHFDLENNLPTISPSKHFDWQAAEAFLVKNEVVNLSANNLFTASIEDRRIQAKSESVPQLERVSYWAEVINSRVDKCTVLTVPHGRTHALIDALSPLISGVPFLSEESIAHSLLEHSSVYGWGLMTTAVSDFISLEGASISVFDGSGIFSKKAMEKTAKRRMKDLISSLKELVVGDLVVHVKHGIAQYKGLKNIEVSGVFVEFLELKFSGDDKLYLPVDQLQSLQKYQNSGGSEPSLDRLRSDAWSRRKHRARQSIEDIADKLLKQHSQRKMAKGITFSQPSQLYFDFEKSFDFTETSDQLKAIEEVNADMSSPRPMERLICGDVGFGKTEVALRSSMRAVLDGYQIMMIVPTTVLCHQHWVTFCDRFEAFGVSVEKVNRFVVNKKIKQVLNDFKSGKVDILICTHRGLSKDVKPKKLGLLIIDEEQKFGVKHKEMISHVSKGCDVLTMTATPIPRTLHLAVSGFKDVSLIQTPPRRRLPVKTFLCDYDDPVIFEGIRFEVARGGQVFFVHNVVEDIENMAMKIKEQLPNIRIAIGHGQLPPSVLEKRIVEFLSGKYHILLCTTIIESGIDMPNVNTLVVNNANRFGLSQLYQLKGRVGRSTKQAYCYLVADRHSLSQSGRKRLEILRNYSDLGSGFQIASFDLDLRGAGNILGGEQSGHLDGIGFELYAQMLEDAVSTAMGDSAPPFKDTEIKLPIKSSLGSDYISSEGQRLQVYRRLFAAEHEGEVSEIVGELKDRFGDPPKTSKMIFAVARFKALLGRMLVMKASIGLHGLLELEMEESSILCTLRESQAEYGDLFNFLGSQRMIVNIKITSVGDRIGEDMLQLVWDKVRDIAIVGGLHV